LNKLNRKRLRGRGKSKKRKRKGREGMRKEIMALLLLTDSNRRLRKRITATKCSSLNLPLKEYLSRNLELLTSMMTSNLP
jgi:hypothetical protein